MNMSRLHCLLCHLLSSLLLLLPPGFSTSWSSAPAFAIVSPKPGVASTPRVRPAALTFAPCLETMQYQGSVRRDQMRLLGSQVTQSESIRVPKVNQVVTANLFDWEFLCSRRLEHPLSGLQLDWECNSPEECHRRIKASRRCVSAILEAKRRGWQSPEPVAVSRVLRYQVLQQFELLVVNKNVVE